MNMTDDHDNDHGAKRTAIIIPARYGSTRFPGKPLAKIAGQSMLQRVVEVGRKASDTNPDIDLYVATEDTRIEEHCREIGVPCIMTSADCPTGSDRLLEAVQKTGKTYDFVIGLQGDAPCTPADAIAKMISRLETEQADVVTPVIKLRWSELDALRESKKTTPFSGTTAIVNAHNDALWFSKTIIPAIRNEQALRQEGEYSPVLQHLGLYGYRLDVLEYYVNIPQSPYEQLEGLEQLRMLENGIEIKAVFLDVDAGMAQAGVDSPEDVARIETLLSQTEQRQTESHQTEQAHTATTTATEEE